MPKKSPLAGIDPAVFDDPEVRRLLRPGLLKFLAEIRVVPVVDEATGQIIVPMDKLAAALGMSEADVVAGARAGGTVTIAPDRIRPLQ